MKVVINRRHGGFGLSSRASREYCRLAAISENDFDDYRVARDDPNLVAVVEQLGQAADGDCAQLKIVEVPDDVEWSIQEYDGLEWVAEQHRTWS